MSVSATVWDYAPVVPTIIALVNGVIAVYVGHFKPESQWLKVSLLLFAIIAGLAAAAATFAGQYHVVEAQRLAQASNAQHLATLGKLIEEGDAVQRAVGNVNVPVNSDEVSAWVNETEGFLSKELGAPFVSRFRDYAGLVPPQVPLNMFSESLSGPHAQNWARMTYSLARLQQFSEELSARLR